MSRCWWWAFVLVIAAVAASCPESDQTMDRGPARGPVVKLRVYKDGRVTLDDHPATMSEVGDALDRLRSERGSVLYYREAGQEEPPPVAMEVMHAIVEARLPVRLSSKPDFSDAIGPDGIPRSR